MAIAIQNQLNVSFAITHYEEWKSRLPLLANQFYLIHCTEMLPT